MCISEYIFTSNFQENEEFTQLYIYLRKLLRYSFSLIMRMFSVFFIIQIIVYNTSILLVAFRHIILCVTRF